MKKENHILKWFNKELKSLEIDELKADIDNDVYSKIEHYSSQLEPPQVDAKKALRDFRSKQISNQVSESNTLNLKSFLRIAAILIIMLGASYFVFFNKQNSFETHLAEIETIHLPDDSEVILNAKSKLSFNKKEWDKQRNLDLKGEAFFKVSKGETFTVNTPQGMIKVLGTQFNVKERENYFEVQCFEGSVLVNYKKDEAILTPGKTFRILNGKEQEVEEFSVLSPSWINDESSFDNVPLEFVIEEIERQYNIKVEIENINLDVLFNGTFTHRDINKAFQSITIPLRLAYKIEDKKVIIYNYNGE